MAVKSKLSQADLQGYDDGVNQQYVDGFAPSDGAGGFDSFFDDSSASSLFDAADFGSGGSNSSGFGFGDTGFGGTGFGDSSTTDIFGNSVGFGDGFGSDNGMGLFGGEPVEQKPDITEKLMEASGEALKSMTHMLIEIFKSLRLRNADDMGYLNRNILIIGGALAVVTFVGTILGAIGDVKMLKLGGITGQLLITGILLTGTGMIGLALSAMAIAKSMENGTGVGLIDDLPNVSDIDEEDVTEVYEEDAAAILDDLFSDGDDDDNLLGEELDFNELTEEDEEEDILGVSSLFDDDNSDSGYDYGSGDSLGKSVEERLQDGLDNVVENQLITRERLVNTFKDILPKSTPTFADKEQIDEDSDDFKVLDLSCRKAIQRVLNLDSWEKVDTKLAEAYETFFSYELMIERTSKLTGQQKLLALGEELENYLSTSEDSEENALAENNKGVTASVTLYGDYYKAVVRKGVSPIVTIGDALGKSYVENYFKDKDNKLPVIVGINELGRVVLEDAKVYDSVIIAGKARFGKSWYVSSFLMSMFMFNTPQDVTAVICDPKDTPLMSALGVLPHILGVHDKTKIQYLLRDFIDNEAPRRKKILKDNDCDDIWALRKKGIHLPITYLIIDEVMTITSFFETKNDKEGLQEFQAGIRTIQTQFPSIGLRVLLVPHRATGVIDKTVRTLSQVVASVCGSNEEIKELLDTKKWEKPLIRKGDTVIKTIQMVEPMYVRGAAVACNDDDMKSVIRTVAKAFYKMGVEVAEQGSFQMAYKRNEREISEALYGSADGIRNIQYDSSRRMINHEDDVDDVDTDEFLNEWDDDF